MIWFLTLLAATSAAGVAGWCVGVWWGRRVGDEQQPNREQP